MYNNEKLRIYIISFLSFCVLTSKNILIYNEETLVALSFFCFLFFVYHYYGITLRGSLNEKSQDIQYYLQSFLTHKETSSRESLKEHQKVSGLVEAIKNIDMFTNRECTGLNGNDKIALRNFFLVELEQKLKNLTFSDFQQKLQHLYSDFVYSYLLLSCKKAMLKKTKTGNLLTQLRKKSIKKAHQLLAQKVRY